MRRTLLVFCAVFGLSSATSQGIEFNPQEVGLVVDNFLVDTDASVIGLLDRQNGGTHGITTFTNRSTYAGQPSNAMVTEPLATRVEWEVWRSRTLATISGDAYEIDYRGYLKDTRVSAAEDPKYDVRWESKWYKNDPLKLATYAEGGGIFKFVDPDFDFDISVDPLNPSEVTLSGSASATLWGVLELTIEGSKNLGTGILSASAGASVDVPLISDVLGSLASAAFVFEYNQSSGLYESRIEGSAFFGLWEEQAVVNGGSIRAPAVKVPPGNNAPPVEAEPPFTHTIDGKWVITPHGVNVVVPAVGGSGATSFTDSLDPFGDLSDEIATLFPNQFTQTQQLYSHPGYIDQQTFPFDLPTSSIAFSYQDPTLPFNPTGGPPPGITLSPIEIGNVPEPGTLVLFTVGLAWLMVNRARRHCRF